MGTPNHKSRGTRYGEWQWREMIAAYKGGKTLDEAAAVHGATSVGLWRQMRKRGVSRRHAYIVGEEAASLVRLAESGLWPVTIGERIGRSASVVRQAARRLGVPPITDMRQFIPREDYFAEIDTDEKAYWLGFIAADGCVHLPKSAITIALQRDDRGHLEKFRAIVSPTSPICNFNSKTGFSNRTGEKRYPQSSVTIRSKRMIADLARQGIGPRKSLTMSMWDGPEELLPAWFRGLIDGDGCWRCFSPSDRSGQLRVSVELIATTAVAEAFRDWVGRNVGGIATSFCVAPCAAGALTIIKYSRLATVQAIARRLYEGETVWLDRKKAIADRIISAPLNYRHRTITHRQPSQL